MKNFIEELKWRWMLHDSTPEVEEHLNSQIVKGYVGFDPTADSLHIGNLATIMLLVHLQRCGHQPIALVGGATGMVGDPSGKSAERNLLDEDTLRRNQAGVKKQLEHFLDFSSKENPAILVNNYDWFKEIGFLQFLKEVGKYLTVNYMMAKDSVKNRLENESGISFTEFSYQLLQAYDFYHLHNSLGVTLQMGGSDQWGNITSGTELIRKKIDGKAYAITTPLITKQDGSKFGKSEEGNVWLDATKTSPYKFYQFWLNVSDEEAPRLIRVYTTLDRSEIEALEAQHAEGPHLRILQKTLAEEVTKTVHGELELKKAEQASAILFGKSNTEDLANLDEATFLEIFSGVPKYSISKSQVEMDIVEILATLSNNELLESKGAARKLIASGGVSVNGVKVLEPTSKGIEFGLLKEKYLLVKKGKKNYYIYQVEN